MNRSLTVKESHPKQILTPASGFLKGYTHTLNPYVGCSFGCSYCYVRRMPVGLFRKEEWGKWVDIKKGATEVLEKDLVRARKKGDITIFMSSSTDPYQPIESNTELTRSLLTVMTVQPPDFLFLQTRGPLIVRDIDLLLKLKKNLLVSVTIETDREDIRKVFTPTAPPVQARFKALQKLKEAGLPVQIAVSPVLPSTASFAQKVREVASRVVIDDYFMGDGQNGKRTKQLGMEQYYKEVAEESWFSPTAYVQVLNQFKTRFTDHELFVSQEGFMPPNSYGD
ncbi:SPL family radical SAM protein [Bacillus horti]|uniref:DNA repair photolyase n=1 Tax=Caldalkalibacillus horti TaxID=77523 RepID=A0ABT9VWR8_9BACI|nr:radical SAM protein [Bacillus horti]MDQ0165443.1 DNA repair photolyase [Bacillus horti]